MNPELIRRMVDNMDEEDARQVLEEVDFEAIFEMAAPYIADAIEPHLDDIRVRAQSEDPMDARRYYASLPEDEQQAVFEETVADLVTTVRECREEPDIGLSKLKKRIRDPDVIEPLLLIFESDEHIDPQYAEDTKDFAATLVRWAGAQIIPEIYTQQELGELQSRLNE